MSFTVWRTCATGWIVAIAVVVGASVAWAHGVGGSMWLDVKPTRKLITVTAYHGTGLKCEGAKVFILDENGNLLLEGETDRYGLFSYKPPIFDTMIILVETTDGHRIEHVLKAKKKKRTSTPTPQPEPETTPAADPAPVQRVK
ncbi:MAG: hypothetical protein P9L99_21135 [Candidatus Lernaella stagnicola]|nr:hypothetical protein [Candidatus Lernaella stagnicola]